MKGMDMNQDAIFQHIREALTELEDFRTLIVPAEVQPEHRLVEDLGLDSVSLLDLTVGLERRIGRAIDESTLVELRTLAAIARHLEEAS